MGKPPALGKGLAMGLLVLWFGGLVLFPAILSAKQPVTPRVGIQPDGVLVEWGRADRIAVEPGGDQVGMGGVIEGSDDHEADVYVHWDGEFLFVAATVEDDIVDVAHITPEEQVWHGPGKARKDKMFYYDHFKVFVRGPNAPLGHNIWTAPRTADLEPYTWGSMQRNPGSDEIPLAKGSAAEPGSYSYELAIPWTWLGIYPEPDMVLDALFLFSDADAPDLELKKKVKERSNQVWWKGKLVLVGQPANWTARVEVATREVKEEQQEIIGRLERAQSRIRVKEEEKAKVAAAQKETAKEPSPTAPSPTRASSPTPATPAQAQASAQTQSSQQPSLRAKLNRQRLGRKPEKTIPAWVKDIAADLSLNEAQVRIYYDHLTTTLNRLSAERVNSRTDILVIDMASKAKTFRGVAREFMQALLAGLDREAQHSGSDLGEKIVQASQELGIDPDLAVAFVGAICRQGQEIYGDNKVSTTHTIIKKGAKNSGLSVDEGHKLFRALTQEWGL